jgi:hypothetical protein
VYDICPRARQEGNVNMEKKTQSQSSYGHLSVGGVLLGLSFLPRFNDS